MPNPCFRDIRLDRSSQQPLSVFYVGRLSGTAYEDRAVHTCIQYIYCVSGQRTEAIGGCVVGLLTAVEAGGLHELQQQHILLSFPDFMVVS